MNALKNIFPKIKNQNAVRRIFNTTNNESGAILIMAMLLMIVVVLLVSGVINMTSSDFARTANYDDSRRAFYITEAGVEAAKALVRTQDFDEFLTGTDLNKGTTADNGLIHDGTGTLLGTEVTINSVKYSQVNYDGGTYSVRVFDNEDEATNDPHEDSDNIIVIQAIGETANNSTKTITAAVRKYNLPPGEFPAAVTMVGPSTAITAGGAINVNGGNSGGNGFGWDMSSYLGTPSATPSPDPSCPSKNAIVTETSSSAVTENWIGGSADGFNGSTNPDSINDGFADIAYDVTTFDADAASNMRAELKEYCDICFTGHHVSTDTHVEMITTGTYGTVADPIILYVDGNATIAAGTEGAGVIIIDGDTDIAGSFDYAGVILIGSCSSCWGILKGVGTARIHGAMVVGNGLIDSAAGTFSGSADIYYSCEGIAVAENVFAKSFKNVGWFESD